MEVNPDATLRAVQSAEDFIENRLKHIDGNIFNKAGDSLLLIFKNPEDALKVAIDFQLYNVTKNSSDENEINVEFRLGINIGEVTQSGSDYLGDGVNIAARLETLSQPNGICISKSFYEKIKHGPEVRFKNLGNKKVKENKFIAFDIITPWYQKRKIQTESFTIISFIAIAVVILITATFFGNIHSLAMEEVGHVAGAAASLIGSVSTVIAVIVAAIAGSYYNDTITPIVLCFTVLMLPIIYLTWFDTQKS